MKMMTLQTELEVFANESELSKQEQELVDIAYKQAEKAYAPYSNFRVGCAILLENGTIVGGSNQENASYPAGICAERTALSACASQYPNVKPLVIAIVVNDRDYKSNSACAPCGICRQSICEIENRYQDSVQIIFPAENGSFYKIKSIESILPLMFNSENLK